MEGNGSDGTPRSNHDLRNYQIFHSALLYKNFELANAYMANICTSDCDDRLSLLEDLLNVFVSHKLGIPFLKYILSEEIDNTSNPRELFREVSVSTLLMDILLKKVGSSFLKSTFGLIIRELVKDPEKNYEVDTNRVDQDIATENCILIIDHTKNILDAIEDNIIIFPLCLQILFNHIRNTVKAKFSGYWNLSVGSFLFLRYICTSIVFPENWSIIEEIPSNTCRRGLILVSKLLQKLANNREFDDKKEPYMIAMNQFIIDNKLSIYDILDNYSNLSQGKGEIDSPTIFRIAARRITDTSESSVERSDNKLNTHRKKRSRSNSRSSSRKKFKFDGPLYKVSPPKLEQSLRTIVFYYYN
eukprot:TRINITY_DN7448_c0_g1_i1.p1 TRINITY_DN7448_c0_g1~~TRINITY_DN7448_c0_g1_i1.p1  ORF type:complete len:358 (-),score=63.01 TRINITY_DN7448_c0_g1_i1:693-1766(-)